MVYNSISIGQCHMWDLDLPRVRLKNLGWNICESLKSCLKHRAITEGETLRFLLILQQGDSITDDGLPLLTLPLCWLHKPELAFEGSKNALNCKYWCQQWLSWC